MSQLIRGTSTRSRISADRLIDGDSRVGEERLIGGDTGLAAVMARRAMVSRSSAPVLLYGETGTGKEIVARALHEHSPFRDRPLPPRQLRRDCVRAHRLGALRPRAGRVHRRHDAPQRLVRAGRWRNPVPRRGRRTGASRAGAAAARRAGWRGGTRRRRAAGTRERPHRRRDPPRSAGHGRSQTFREDLYYRLSVFPIVIPPLRDRPGDIRAFAEYFADRAANRFGLRRCRSPTTTSGADGVSLARQRARDGGGDGSGRADRSGTRAQRRGGARPGRADAPARCGPCLGRAAGRHAIEPLDVVMRRHIEAALRDTAGRVEGPHGAARVLRINPHTLRARMRKLKVDWRGFRAPREADA